jgi:hypothetical protein
MIDPSLSHRHDVSITPRMLRQFAGLWLAFFTALACWQWFGRDRVVLALACVALALVVGPLGLARPLAIRPLFSGLLWATRPIGWVVSHVNMAAVYYGLFTPMAFVFRLIGRDALTLRPQPRQESYWTVKPMSTDLRGYFRQF